MRDVADPVAIVSIRWRGQNHRAAVGSTMAATAVFVRGHDDQIIPSWPAEGEHFSVLFAFVGSADDSQTAKVDFLDRALVADYLRKGAIFLVMAGPKPIAEARITRLLWQPDV